MQIPRVTSLSWSFLTFPWSGVINVMNLQSQTSFMEFCAMVLV